jgi:hypothetical protein
MAACVEWHTPSGPDAVHPITQVPPRRRMNTLAVGGLDVRETHLNHACDLGVQLLPTAANICIYELNSSCRGERPVA